MSVDDNARYAAAVTLMATSEQVRWARLNTFLVANSILFLAWVSLFALPGLTDPAKEWIMSAVCVLGFFSSTGWAVLGKRGSDHLRFYRDTAITFEQSGPPAPSAIPNWNVVEKGKGIVGHPHKLWSSEFLVSYCPLIFGVAYAVLFIARGPWSS
jgi:hypothetical protein